MIDTIEMTEMIVMVFNHIIIKSLNLLRLTICKFNAIIMPQMYGFCIITTNQRRKQMKKSILLMLALLMFAVCGNVIAYTVELDPITPLTGYIALGGWNINGDFEDWTTFQTADPAVFGGSLTGRVVGNDMNISLNIVALPTPDARIGNAVITGSVYEIRLRFDPSTVNQRIDLFPTMDGAFKVPPLQFANNADPALPDIPVDGAFHVYRMTFDAGDVDYLGKLDALRFDILADWGTSNETFEIDYYRIANVAPNPLTVDGVPLPTYTSLAEWNTDGDIENWMLNGITNETVSGGIFSGEPNSGDPWFYKSNGMGLPAVNLALAPYAEFRLKQAASITASEIEIFFGTTNNPGLAGDRRLVIGASEIPHDGQFHIYRYRMADHPDWNGVLEGFRVDPYTIVTSERFEVDYVRVGNTIIPEPALLLGIFLAGIAIFRKRF